jgi:hypothetical protein
MKICFCPPLVVMGRVEFTQLAGLKLGLSCKTQFVALSGHENPKPPPTGAEILTTGSAMKFATKV